MDIVGAVLISGGVGAVVAVWGLLSQRSIARRRPQLPTCFGWLGVTPYLEVSDILGTLSSIRKLAAVGSSVVFDYIHSDAFDPSRSTKEMQELIESVRSRGEPLLGAFEPQDLEKQLAGIGFKIQENLSPEYIQERYFQGRSDGYHAMEQVHFAWATVE